MIEDNISSVDFWFNNKFFINTVSNDGSCFSVDLIRLASIRTAISNFVRILTKKNIPVYFKSDDIPSGLNRDGKVIYITSKIYTKNDFDVTVGLSLHEGAHSLLSDFDMIKIAASNIPSHILKIADLKNIRRSSLEIFIHKIWNIIEDRYIDNYIFKNIPGYRGYYISLYNRLWNSPEIDKLLLSDICRWPSLDSYLFRICNLTNINTDFNALPRLNEIADIIDLSNIDRLKTTQDRINIGLKIVEVVLNSVSENNHEDTIQTQQEIIPSDDAGTKFINEISDIISGKNQTPNVLNENKEASIKLSDKKHDTLENIYKEVSDKQMDFIMGKFQKDSVSPEQSRLLDLIEKNGISLIKVGNDLLEDKTFKVHCIVVNKMTRDLIFSGRDIFPLSNVMSSNKFINPPKNTLDAVNKGISLGIKLGKKLKIRTEHNLFKVIRKKSGKIYKRHLYKASFDSGDLFYKNQIELYNKAIIHITVDASRSMMGSKWENTITSVVSICKAASMVDNVHVTVSLRTTQFDGNKGLLPYIIIAYDSKVDSFKKVQTLFPYLEPNGCTPEGLAFEATMDLFKKITPDETDRYFFNLSDGEPFYYCNTSENIKFLYSKQIAINHTKKQVNKIKSCNVKILSYFIKDKDVIDNDLKENFIKMYGKESSFIEVDNIVDLSRTINKLFLSN